MKDFKKKIEFCRFAFVTCVKTLIKLRFFLRGVSFDKESYLDQLKTRSNNYHYYLNNRLDYYIHNHHLSYYDNYYLIWICLLIFRAYQYI